MKKMTITQEDLDKGIRDAVDEVLAPLLKELTRLGVSVDTVIQAMNNVMQRVNENDNTTKG